VSTMINKRLKKCRDREKAMGGKDVGKLALLPSKVVGEEVAKDDHQGGDERGFFKGGLKKKIRRDSSQERPVTVEFTSVYVTHRGKVKGRGSRKDYVSSCWGQGQRHEGSLIHGEFVHKRRFNGLIAHGGGGSLT